ncbi:hypothetical protein D047_1279B, partial [Vibrio parahaemolyticus VPTS-2010_2]
PAPLALFQIWVRHALNNIADFLLFRIRARTTTGVVAEGDKIDTGRGNVF